MNPYRPQEFEPRWQAFWQAEGLHRARNPGEPGFDPRQPKFYVLDMFPYPSGSGLHVGHALGYVGTDVVARKKRMQGFNVLHPMGWDAFGLPAEQYAIQTGKHPRATTDENTANFRRQLQKIGLSYDWSREIDTSQVGYYRWTQWLFSRLYERGLAYRAEVPVWWCEELKTVLANEEVINGRSERGNFPCVRRPLKQWMLKITAYAERLLSDLETLDWPESIKIQQREWIGRSEGAEVRFPAEGAPEPITVFTTRPDTLWGATFLVLAPEHALVKRLTTAAQRAAVESYVAAAASKSEVDRSDASRQKTGVWSGAWAHNPVFEPGDPRGRVPIWIADYVLAQYGTGAIMSVPGHDERDFEFAKAFGLEIREVVRPPQGVKGLAEGVPFTGDGTALNSGPIDGLATPEAQRRTNAWLEERGLGKARVTYKLRDWLFSRQRYWGEPFPLLHLEDGSVVPVPDELLPVELPVMEDFKPASDGSAPLARAKDWVATIDPRTKKPARRDTDTMPGWAGSCWYWLRFMDPHNGKAAFAPEAEQYWGPVDLYVGGAAHAVMHLLYARFWHKVFFDAGLVHTPEPFQKLYNQGMVTAFAYEDSSGRLVASDEVEWQGEKPVRRSGGEPLKQIVTKMAKSLKNVVNPDDIIAEYGCDAFRLYELFMGPLDESKPWNTRDIPGCRRFCERVWRLFVDPEADAPVRANLAPGARERAPGASDRASGERAPGASEHASEADVLALERALARMLQKAEESFRHFNFNTAIAAMMTFLNEAQPLQGSLTRSQGLRFLACLAPFAPHMAEELWHRMGEPGTVTRAPWPLAEARFLERDELEIPVQVLGKLRARVTVPKASTPAQIESAAREAVAALLVGKQILKVVYVDGRLVNFVVK